MPANAFLQSLQALLRISKPALVDDAVCAPPLGLEEIRQRNLAMLDDCVGPDASRMRQQLTLAPSAQALWMLRCDVYQVMAREHSEPEASRRIRALASSFAGWVPPTVLARAQAVAA